MGNLGESYEQPLAEIVIGLLKTEATKRRSWRSRDEAEWETLGGFDWYKNP